VTLPLKEEFLAEDLRKGPAGLEGSEGTGYDVFVSYSRVDRRMVEELVEALARRGKRAWVDLEDIPPSAAWMEEIRSAIDGSQAYLVVLSPDFARSPVCSEELLHAEEAGKRIVPVLVSPTDPATVPGALARLNWIDATNDDLESACDAVVLALETDFEHVKSHTRLLLRANDWVREGEHPSSLLRSRELAEAEQMIAESGRDPEPTQLQTRFVLASRKAAGRRQRALIGGISVALVVALVLGTLAVLQRQEAVRQRRAAIRQREQAIEQRDLARSGDLASSALAELQRDPELSLLLSLEAAEIRETDRVTAALRESLESSNLEFVFRGHHGKVADLAFGPGGDTVASVGYDNTILIWDTESGAIQRTIDSDRIVYGLAFDPAGRWVAAGVPGAVIVWNASTGEMAREMKVPGTVYQVEFAAGGELVVGGGDGGTRVWQTTTGTTVLALPPGPGGTYGADVTTGGDLIATGNGDGSIRIFDGHTGDLLRTTEGHDDLAFFVRFDETGDRIVSVGLDRTARVWDTGSGQQVVAMTHAALVEDASFVHDDFVVTSDSEGVARVWNVASGEVVSELRGHTDFVAFVAASPIGDRIATASDDGTVRIWRLGPGVSLVDISREGFAWAAEYTTDGSGVLTAGESGSVDVWDAESGARQGLLFDGEGEEYAVDVASVVDAETVAVAVRETAGDSVVAGAVVFVDASTGDRRAAFRLEGDVYPLTVELDRTGERAISVWTDGTARVIGSDGAELAQFQGKLSGGGSGASLAEFSPDGATAAVVDRGTIELVDLGTGEVVRNFEVSDGQVVTLAFAPGGDRLAGGLDDGTARIWDVTTGEEVTVLRGHTADLESVAFDADGAFLVTSARDGTARVWTAAEGTEIQRYQPAEFVVTSAVFSRDGRRILVAGLVGFRGVPTSVGYDSSHRSLVRIYDCDVCRSFDDLVVLARSRVTRQLTPAERAEYLGET